MSAAYIKGQPLTKFIHSVLNSGRVNMRLQPQVPTVEEAVQHFRDMAAGNLRKRPDRKRRLYGGWGGTGPSIIKTTLVTPTAQAEEQAIAQLKRQGEKIPTAAKKKPPTRAIKGGARKKSTQSVPRQRTVKTKKKTAQSAPRRRTVKQ